MHALERKFAESIKALKIENNTPIAIACSGGPDSMALALVAAWWAKTAKIRPIALIVDHGLRAESAREARQVAGWLKKRGINHAILTWEGRKPTRNIQENARKARYALLADYCKAHGITHLLVAHHLEDQAETFLLRLARGSGVDGLAAMAPLTPLHGITLVRPFLQFTKAELLFYLSRRRQEYVRDPSNVNLAFERVKIRHLLPALAEVGLTSERIAKTAVTMARARTHLEEETGKFLSAACVIHPEGYAMLSQVSASEEIGLRALAALIMILGGHAVRTRLHELERLYFALKDMGFRGATLGGCVFARNKGAILIYRETRAVAAPIALHPGKTLIWDNRFEVTLAKAPLPLHVGALTQAGWLKLAKIHALKNPFPNKHILYGLPALYDSAGNILAAPHLKIVSENDNIAYSLQFRQPDTLFFQQSHGA